MRNLDVEIPAGEVEREFNRIAQSFQRRARIAGFRPGKAPLGLVRQQFNGKIREEMIETLVPAHLRAAFERENLEPVSTPTLDNLDYTPGAAIKFKASFEVMPEIRLGDYRSIRVQPDAVTVTDQEVDDQIAALRERHARREPSSAAEVGDGAVAVVEAQRLDHTAESGAAPAGGLGGPHAGASTSGTRGPAAQGPAPNGEELGIEVGAPDTLPEFSATLRGMKPAEERELEVSYPAEYPNPAFAGKTQRYHLKLLRIETKILPELSDEFVRQASGAENLADLRVRISANLRRQRELDARHQAEDKVVDELLRQSPFPVPESLVDKQVETKLERRLHSLAEQGIDPRKLKLDWAKLRAGQEESARREVQAALLLEKIAAQENIEAPPEAVEDEVKRAAEELKQPEAALRARLESNGVLARIKTRIRQERTMDFLLRQGLETS